MCDLGEFEEVPLREIWQNEANQFHTLAGGKY